MASNNEQDRRETLADIVRDIRDRADCAERHGDRETHNDGVAMLLRSIADRIEAAAMREALEDFSRTMYNEALYCCTEKAMIGKYDNTQLSLCKSCVARGCECWQMTLAREAKTALSAPARNCDRFADELDAQLAFLNEVWLISVDRETMLERDKFENWTEEMKTRYGRWLLAPAAERKGEGDGSK